MTHLDIIRVDQIAEEPAHPPEVTGETEGLNTAWAGTLLLGPAALGACSDTPAGQTGSPTTTTVRLVESGEILAVSVPDGALPEAAVEGLEDIAGVETVQPYLRWETEPHPILGVRPGDPIRIRTGGQVLIADLVDGRVFEPGDEEEWIAVVGAAVVAEDYRAAGEMPGMVHFLLSGQSIVLPTGQRVRIVGVLTTAEDDSDRLLVLPLPKVQELAGTPGEVSGFWIRLVPGTNLQLVIAAITQIVPNAEVAVVMENEAE